MTFVWTSIALVACCLIGFWAGTKYGNKLEADARAELQQLRNRLAGTIKGKG